MIKINIRVRKFLMTLSGVCQYVVPRYREMVDTRMGISLRNAITEGKLTLCYQPQIFTGDEKLYGVEALARWEDSVFGPVSPQRFVNLASKTGVISNLDNWVLRTAIQQLAEWRQIGLNIPCVSVNMSPQNLQDCGLVHRLRKLLEKYRISGESLTIELTENDMIEMNDFMISQVGDIRKLGVGVSVDDFGTGFSGLARLTKLPVTEIKIDKSFVNDLLSKTRSNILTEAMINLGQRLEITVIVEGVETQEQLDYLKALSCTVVQGHLYSRPLPVQQFVEWIRHRGISGV